MNSFSCLLAGFVLFTIATAAPAPIASNNLFLSDLETTSRQSTCSAGRCALDDPQCMARLAMQYTNEFRGQNGLPALAQGSNSQFDNALRYSGQLRSMGFLRHQPRGLSTRCGTTLQGENIARNHCDDDPARKCVDAWIGSTLHRNNMLNPQHETVSVGIVFGRGTEIWCTQTFGINTQFESTGSCAPLSGSNRNAPPAPSSSTPTTNNSSGPSNQCADFVRPELMVRGNTWMVRSVDGDCRYCIVNTDRCASAEESARVNAQFINSRQ